MRKITHFIVHCTATKAFQAVTVAQIDAWHRARGFRCIGYHYVISQDGTVAVGRPEEQIGAHAVGYNQNSIGIAYVGGLDSAGRPSDTRTPQQCRALRSLIERLHRKWPEAVVIGHNEVAPKACPCFDVRKEFGRD